MSDALFLDPTLPDPLPPVGAALELLGEEGRHAAVVRRIGPDEVVLVADGAGRAVRGRVTSASKAGLVLEVLEHRTAEPPSPRVVVVQALAKGDRGELAVEMLTEVGVTEIWPWQSSRAVVRWQGERGERSLARWRSTAREAAKQSRRLRVPEVGAALSTKQLCAALAGVELALVLHEEATEPLADVARRHPDAAGVALVVGPEGGISPDELAALAAAGAHPVLVSDGVLRTSTAGLVGVVALLATRWP